MTHGMSDAMEAPYVLIVDDEPGTQVGLVAQLQDAGLRADALYPEEVSADDLSSADLILVDQRLSEWHELAGVASLARLPIAGLAVAAVLRAHIVQSGKRRPTGVAVHSGH